MATFPALPLWTDAWIADTNHLTRAERGMYHDLLVLMWRTPSCSVPNDMEWLTKHLRLSLDEIVALKSLIKEFCHFDANGMEVAYAREMPVASERLYQKRLSKEWAYLKEQSKRQSQNAKSRWKKEKIVCQTDANGMEVAYAPTPTPTPTPTVEEDTLRVSSSLAHANGHSFDIFWEAYPHKVGKRYCQNVAFPAAVKRAPLEIIIAGLERYTASKPPDRAWCNPATFLNQDRWNDQPATQGNGHARPQGSSPASKLFEGAARALAKRERDRAERQVDSGEDINAPVPLLDR